MPAYWRSRSAGIQPAGGSDRYRCECAATAAFSWTPLACTVVQGCGAPQRAHVCRRHMPAAAQHRWVAIWHATTAASQAACLFGLSSWPNREPTPALNCLRLRLPVPPGAKDFLVDCLALKADMQLLDPVLSNPRIMKASSCCGCEACTWRAWQQPRAALHAAPVPGRRHKSPPCCRSTLPDLAAPGGAWRGQRRAVAAARLWPVPGERV